MGISKRRLGLFLGAGVEVGYGLPAGGQFALDIFRQSSAQARENVKTMLGSIDATDSVIADWLPSDYQARRVYAFGIGEYEAILRSTIEAKQRLLIGILDGLDSVPAAQRALGVGSDFGARIRHITGRSPTSISYKSQLCLNKTLKSDNGLFSSRVFSSLLEYLRHSDDSGASRLKEIVRALLELYVAAHGERLVSSLNDSLFEQAPSLDIFDDFAGLFRLDLKQVGVSALKLVIGGGDPPGRDPVEEVAFGCLTHVLSMTLDYQALVDSHYRYLFQPQSQWAKFTKMAVFLYTVRDYIESFASRFPGYTQGYYHDFCQLDGSGWELEVVGTGNYNEFVQGFVEPRRVFALHGCVDDLYEPCLNLLVSRKDPTQYDGRFVVPMLLTQSGTKPLTSVTMARRMVELFDAYQECDTIAVLGYGFNGDDGHVNGMFRQLLRDGKRLLVFHYDPGLGEPHVNEYLRKLRIHEGDVEVISVNSDRETKDGMWFESL